MADKGQIAVELARSHGEWDSAILRIYRVLADNEDDRDEPVKLLEVNPDTAPMGIVPIIFGPDPPEVPYPSVVIEVTEGEFAAIVDGGLRLPDGWHLRQPALWEAAARAR